MSRTDMTTEKILWHLVRRGYLPQGSLRGKVTARGSIWRQEIESPIAQGDIVRVCFERRRADGSLVESVDEQWECKKAKAVKGEYYYNVKATWERL